VGYDRLDTLMETVGLNEAIKRYRLSTEEEDEDTNEYEDETLHQ
jgi:hypothetical protein